MFYQYWDKLLKNSVDVKRMYRTRDFIDKEVFLIGGKKLGVVSGILVDLKDKKVKSLMINHFGIFKKKYVAYNDIISIGSKIIAGRISSPYGINLDRILMKHVYDKNGILRGNVSDVLIGEQTMELEGIICYSGLKNKIKSGNILIPFSEIILGDEYILDKGNGHITFNSVIHKAEEVMLNENSK